MNTCKFASNEAYAGANNGVWKIQCKKARMKHYSIIKPKLMAEMVEDVLPEGHNLLLRDQSNLGKSFRLAEQQTGGVFGIFRKKSEGNINDLEGEDHFMVSAQAHKNKTLYTMLGYEQQAVTYRER